MKKWSLFLVLLSTHLVTIAYAQQEVGTLNREVGIYIELGGRNDPDAVGGEIGISGYATEHLTIRTGLSVLASESFEDNFVGGTLGVRYEVGKRFSPFIGLGVFAGYSEETVSAEDDGIDNDEDGDTDEDGEEKDVIKDVMGSIYPEIGFHYRTTDTIQLNFAGKYHITTEERARDFWMFTFGIMFIFDPSPKTSDHKLPP